MYDCVENSGQRVLGPLTEGKTDKGYVRGRRSQEKLGRNYNVLDEDTCVNVIKEEIGGIYKPLSGKSLVQSQCKDAIKWR